MLFLFECFCLQYITGGAGLIGADFVVGQFADDFGRAAENHRTGWERLVLRQQCACADDAVRADLDPIKQNGAHTDQCIIAHLCAVHNGAVADGTAGADDRGVAGVRVQDGTILNIRACADMQRFGVAPQHGIEPDTGVLIQQDITDHNRPGGDKDGWVDLLWPVTGMEYHALISAGSTGSFVGSADAPAMMLMTV